MRQITLIRHAVTTWNADRRIQGQSDVELSEEGREQAQALGRRLATMPDISLVYASPLLRSRETARIALP
ncbi:MAG TPA: histidine phosphatase family protein, partial [Trueperaceae bacterium]